MLLHSASVLLQAAAYCTAYSDWDRSPTGRAATEQTTIMGVTSKKFKHGSFGGLVIGLSLTFVHIFGIGLTGTSVNPARSLGPAIVAALDGNSTPMNDLWIFIVAPLVGAALAAIVYTLLESGSEAAQETDDAPVVSASSPAKPNNGAGKNRKKNRR